VQPQADLADGLVPGGFGYRERVSDARGKSLLLALDESEGIGPTTAHRDRGYQGNQRIGDRSIPIILMP
jgi:hypothetical protein